MNYKVQHSPNVVTAEVYRAWAGRARQHIEETVLTADDKAALAAAGLDVAGHPFDRFVQKSMLGRRRGIPPVEVPAFDFAPAWAASTTTSVSVGAGAGEAAITHKRQPHGTPGAQVWVEQLIWVQLYPELGDDPLTIGEATITEPAIAWDWSITLEEAITTDWHAAAAHAEALAAAAAELKAIGEAR